MNITDPTRLLAGFIGINRHIDQNINDLSWSRRDAMALWALWQDTFPETTPILLLDEGATVEGIDAVFSQTLDAATEQDIVILTFSGHGTHNHQLVAHNTELANLAATTISMGTLAERFRRSKARHILLVLDCCFSGRSSAKVIEDGLQSRGDGFSLEDLFTGRGRVLLAASNVDESAWEVGGHGLLSAALVDALQTGQFIENIDEHYLTPYSKIRSLIYLIRLPRYHHLFSLTYKNLVVTYLFIILRKN